LEPKWQKEKRKVNKIIYPEQKYDYYWDSPKETTAELQIASQTSDNE
jgi:hypothetical protein